MGEENVLGSMMGLSAGSADLRPIVPLEITAAMAGVKVT